MLTVFGAAAVTLMAAAYAFEHRHRSFVLAFAGGCALASAYAFLVSAWPLGLVEALWALLALRRFRWRGRAGSSRRGLRSVTPYNRGT